MNYGTHIQLTPQEIDQAIRLRAYEVAKSRGLPVPPDLVDYLNRSKTHISTGPERAPIANDTLTAMITWEGG